MPHVTLEYTNNLDNFDPARALGALNEVLFDSGLFGETDIKSRAVALTTFRTGVNGARRAFVHVRIALLSGRTSEARKALAEAALAALQGEIDDQPGTEVQLSVETVDLDRPSYAKAVLNG